MWNKITPGGAPGRPPMPPAQDDEEADAPATDQVDEEAGDEAPDGGDIGQVLSQRAKSLTPQDHAAFEQGITVPALEVLKKIIPEIAPAIDQMIAKKSGGAGQAPMPAEGQMEAAPPQPAARAPGSRFRQV